jgi:hypothetical protein
MVTLYYYLFRNSIRSEWPNPQDREILLKFDELRATNRVIAESGGEAEYPLLKFDRYAQSPNDSVALNYRYAVLRKYVGPKKGRPPIPVLE